MEITLSLPMLLFLMLMTGLRVLWTRRRAAAA